MWLLGAIAALVEVCCNFQTIPALQIVLVADACRQHHGQRPTIIALAYSERLTTESGDALHLRENLLAGANNILARLRVVGCKHITDTVHLDGVVRLAVEREVKFAC